MKIMHRKDFRLLPLDFSTFAEGQRFVADQRYEALPEEAEVEQIVTPPNPLKVGILINHFLIYKMTHTYFL